MVGLDVLTPSSVVAPTLLVLQVWKSGNQFVRAVIDDHCETGCVGPCSTSFRRHHAATGPPSPPSPPSRAARGLGGGGDAGAGAVIFTFVRDPFDHFVSGYREAVARTHDECCSVPPYNGFGIKFTHIAWLAFHPTPCFALPLRRVVCNTLLDAPC